MPINQIAEIPQEERDMRERELVLHLPEINDVAVNFIHLFRNRITNQGLDRQLLALVDFLEPGNPHYITHVIAIIFNYYFNEMDLALFNFDGRDGIIPLPDNFVNKVQDYIKINYGNIK